MAEHVVDGVGEDPGGVNQGQESGGGFMRNVVEMKAQFGSEGEVRPLFFRFLDLHAEISRDLVAPVQEIAQVVDRQVDEVLARLTSAF